MSYFYVGLINQLESLLTYTTKQKYILIPAQTYEF